MRNARAAWVCATAVVASVGVASTFGASIRSIGVLSETPASGTPVSSLMGISTDGQYAAGMSRADVGEVYPITWSRTGGMTVRTTKGSGYGAGVDLKLGSPIWTSANAGGTGYNSASFIGRAGALPSDVSVLKDHNLANSNVVVGQWSSATIDASGTFAWIVGEHTAGTTSKGNEAYVWKSNTTPDWTVPAYSITASNKTKFKSVAANGRAIGDDRGGQRPAGTTNKVRALYYDAGASWAYIPTVATDGTTEGLGYGISDDGTLLCGYMYPSATNRLQGFIWTYGAATTLALLPAGGDLVNEQCVAFDVSNNGTAVGYSWITATGNRGCIWLPGDTTAKVLYDWLPTQGIDVSQWTKLNSAVGISADGKRIVGEGTWAADGTTRGYYLVLGANIAPIVDAGTDQTVTLPASASLVGTATDDGLPNPPAALTTAWSMDSGPGTVVFGNPAALNTAASFSTAGTYVLKLTADDREYAISDTVTIQVQVGGAPPAVTAAVSSKIHGGAGTFGVDVFASGAVEDRAGGATQIVVTFNEAIQLVGPNPVVVSSGSISGLTLSGASNEVLTIAMSGATDASPLLVTFPGVADATNAGMLCAGSLCLGLLVGDANADRTVNILDLVSIRNQLNLAVTGSNFRTDVNADGSINILDLVTVRNNLNKSVAACP